VRWWKARVLGWFNRAAGIWLRRSAYNTYVGLVAENPGCVAHIKRARSRSAPFRKWADSREGTTDDTMARRTISPEVCTDLDLTSVQIRPRQNVESTTCLDLWTSTRGATCEPACGLWLHALMGTILHHKMQRLMIYNGAKSKGGLFFDNKDNFVGSFYYSTCKFDRANDKFNRTRRFETSHNCCHQERFQTFITTPIGATSIHFVVKRDLQNFSSPCGSLQKFWRHDIKNTQPHLNLCSVRND